MTFKLSVDDITTIHRFATDVSRSSLDHGPRHWRDVARVGSALSAQGVAVDLEVLLLFAATHDTQRENEYKDPDHGKRAAEVIEDLHSRGELGLTKSQLDHLLTALVGHDKGETTADATVGACWDADRLTLWRVGITPDPRFLSTAEAKASDLDFPSFGYRIVHGPDLDWDEIVEACRRGSATDPIVD